MKTERVGHEGHASLVQRAVAECDAVVATVFVNPTQFAPGEDLTGSVVARYFFGKAVVGA